MYTNLYRLYTIQGVHIFYLPTHILIHTECPYIICTNTCILVYIDYTVYRVSLYYSYTNTYLYRLKEFPYILCKIQYNYLPKECPYIICTNTCILIYIDYTECPYILFTNTYTYSYRVSLYYMH